MIGAAFGFSVAQPGAVIILGPLWSGLVLRRVVIQGSATAAQVVGHGCTLVESDDPTIANLNSGESVIERGLGAITGYSVPIMNLGVLASVPYQIVLPCFSVVRDARRYVAVSCFGVAVVRFWAGVDVESEREVGRAVDMRSAQRARLDGSGVLAELRAAAQAAKLN